jgi:rod shape-determining protein MreD
LSSYRSNHVHEAPFAGPVWWVAASVLCGALLLQIEALRGLSFRGAELSIVTVVVVWYALRAGWRHAAVFGLVAGLAEDVFSAQTGGAWTISTTLTALFVSWLSRWFFADSAFVVGGAVAVATLLRRMLFWMVMALQGYPPGYAGTHLHEALWEALLNACFAAAATVAARYWSERRT